MNIVLVNLPHITEKYKEVIFPNSLGLLSIMAPVDKTKHKIYLHTPITDVRDLMKNPDKFYDQCMQSIMKNNPQLIGFTSRCNSYTYTLLIAKYIKKHYPKIPMLLGGPQASVTDITTMKTFPYIDYILRSEADYTFPQLVQALENRIDLASVPGLTYRKKEKITRTPEAPLIEDLDALPMIDYRLLPKEAITNERMNIEVGRGCPYGCTFCSTANYFKRIYRLKSPKRILAEMNAIHALYPQKKRFTFDHDNLTVHRMKLLQMCDAFIASGMRYQWGGSSRIDNVDKNVLKRMKQAGCVSIFFGVETGSQRMQKIIKKYLRIDKIKSTLTACGSIGLSSIASFIVGFPEETESDVEDTLRLIVSGLHMGAEKTHLHALSPLPGSYLARKYAHHMYYSPTAFSDITEIVFREQENMIRKNRNIFSDKYRIRTTRFSDLDIAAFCGFAQLANKFPKTLYAISQVSHHKSFFLISKQISQKIKSTYRTYRNCATVNERYLYIQNLYLADLHAMVKTTFKKDVKIQNTYYKEIFSTAAKFTVN